jgi:Predicted transcriptional regulators
MYMISVAAELAGMHPQTLRTYETKGLVRRSARPAARVSTRRPTSTGCRIIQRLTTELGLNLAGVELVLRLEDELRRAACRSSSCSSRSREDVRNVHKHYRRDLVLYRQERHPERR